MTEPENLVLEYLRAMRTEIADVKRTIDGQTMQLSAIGQQLAGLATAVYAGHSDLDDLRRRIERIERRLELTP